jgi:hypothetical protein
LVQFTRQLATTVLLHLFTSSSHIAEQMDKIDGALRGAGATGTAGGSLGALALGGGVSLVTTDSVGAESLALGSGSLAFGAEGAAGVAGAPAQAANQTAIAVSPKPIPHA